MGMSTICSFLLPDPPALQYVLRYGPCISAPFSGQNSLVQTLTSRGRMAPTSYLFERKGQISIEATLSNPNPTLEALFDTTLSADLNIEDIRPTNSDVQDIVEFELLTPLSELQDIALKFGNSPLSDDWNLKGSDMVYEPVDGVDIVDGEGEGEGIREEKAEGLFKLIDALEIEQDITQVWTNLAR